MTDHHPIAIIGGGLGGLVTARVLHAHGIEAPVFELERDRHARVQGGMLDIHEDSGQEAIHAADLWEPFSCIIHPGGESMRILDHTGTVLYEDHDEGTLERPEVDRGQLRDLLLDSLPVDAVRWGHKAVAVRPVPGRPGVHEVEFTNGHRITTDLLIGADGAWSKVRPLLTDAWPSYTGVSFIEADLLDGARRHPAQAAAMGRGMMFALQDGIGMLGHLESDGTLHVYLALRAGEDWIEQFEADDAEVAVRRMLDVFDGWDEHLRGFITRSDTVLVARRINALPVGLRWDRLPGVTLLGDAAHVMSPFAGEGANLAMQDGARLARAISTGPDDVEAALARYEDDLFFRAAVSAEESAQSLDQMFQPGSPRQLVDMFEAMDAERPTSSEPHP